MGIALWPIVTLHFIGIHFSRQSLPLSLYLHTACEVDCWGWGLECKEDTGAGT